MSQNITRNGKVAISKIGCKNSAISYMAFLPKDRKYLQGKV